MTTDQNPSGYRVSAYRTEEDHRLGRPDYTRTFVDEPGKPSAKERADAVYGEILVRSTYKRFGWRVITRTPLTDPVAAEAGG
ncbi:hypothetical protein [Nonomuraea wenchangensis]|uniref:hypothetical protein n=1 Tax=Nonomuraea wenchangensis TaxID=568860 RepID=UPI00332AE678